MPVLQHVEAGQAPVHRARGANRGLCRDQSVAAGCRFGYRYSFGRARRDQIHGMPVVGGGHGAAVQVDVDVEGQRVALADDDLAASPGADRGSREPPVVAEDGRLIAAQDLGRPAPDREVIDVPLACAPGRP